VSGGDFVPNMPTEEVFCPDWRRAEGRIRTTAPFFLISIEIEGIHADGTIVPVVQGNCFVLVD